MITRRSHVHSKDAHAGRRKLFKFERAFDNFCQQFERAQFEREFDNNISGQDVVISGQKSFAFGGMVNVILRTFQNFNQEGTSTFVWRRMAHSQWCSCGRAW